LPHVSGIGGALRGLAADLGPIRRHADFRRLFTATTVSGFGSAVTMVAAPLQVQRLTHSTTEVGLIGVAELLPLLVVGLWGGALADTVDRRRLALGSQLGLVACSAAFTVNAALARPHLGLVYLVAALAAAAWSLQRPATDAMVPRLVPAADLAPAAALEGFAGSASQIAGPALGGLLAAVDLTAAYAVDTLAGVAALVLLARIRPMPPADREDGEQHPLGLGAIAEGLRFAVARRELLGTYLVDITAMLLAFPDALYPFLAVRLHHPHALGLLYASAGIGAVLASATSGWVGRIDRLGLAVAVCAAAWGAAIGVAGLAPGIVLVVLALVVAGAADMLSGVFRSTLWNRTVPDELRGRLAGIELLSYSSGPSLGGARAGLTASVIGVRAAIATGGLACVLGVGLVTAALPAFRNHRTPTLEP
jgi:MFS family permease